MRSWRALVALLLLGGCFSYKLAGGLQAPTGYQPASDCNPDGGIVVQNAVTPYPTYGVYPFDCYNFGDQGCLTGAEGSEMDPSLFDQIEWTVGAQFQMQLGPDCGLTLSASDATMWSVAPPDETGSYLLESLKEGDSELQVVHDGQVLSTFTARSFLPTGFSFLKVEWTEGWPTETVASLDLAAGENVTIVPQVMGPSGRRLSGSPRTTFSGTNATVAGHYKFNWTGDERANEPFSITAGTAGPASAEFVVAGVKGTLPITVH